MKFSNRLLGFVCGSLSTQLGYVAISSIQMHFLFLSVLAVGGILFLILLLTAGPIWAWLDRRAMARAQNKRSLGPITITRY